MNELSRNGRQPTSWRGFYCLLGLAAALMPVSITGAHAAPAAAAAPKPAVVAKAITEDATLFTRAAVGAPWQTVTKSGDLRTEETILGLPGAALETNKQVRLTLLGDLDRNSPFPVYEAAVILHESPDFDLDFTLERGRVSFTNMKEKGSARVRFRFIDQVWEATLQEPGSKIELLLYGRCASGMAFKKKADHQNVPHFDMDLVVVAGKVLLTHHNGLENRMHAPPGPAFMDWNNLTGGVPSPQKLETLPAWVAEDTTSEHGKEKAARLEAFRKAVLEKKSLDAAIDATLKSEDKLRQRGGIVMLGATDNLEKLSEVLAKSDDPEVWNQAVITARHWIGRAPGQEMKLYQVFTEKVKMKPVHAETILQLLHSFDEAALKNPETYDMLINYLNHDRLGIRGLAYWHLRRLVPEGAKSIKYSPNDPPEAREKAIAEWKKLIPSGTVPDTAKPEGK
jgi:hypothetical protein